MKFHQKVHSFRDRGLTHFSTQPLFFKYLPVCSAILEYGTYCKKPRTGFTLNDVVACHRAQRVFYEGKKGIARRNRAQLIDTLFFGMSNITERVSCMYAHGEPTFPSFCGFHLRGGTYGQTAPHSCF